VIEPSYVPRRLLAGYGMEPMNWVRYSTPVSPFFGPILQDAARQPCGTVVA
jgi:hypothetical protein